jgi:hypothetical protein
MDSLDLLADFASFLGTSGVVFSPPNVESNSKHAITRPDISQQLQGDMIITSTTKQHSFSNAAATAPTVKQEHPQHTGMQVGLSAPHPQPCEQSHGEEVLLGDYTTTWFDGRHPEQCANEELGTNREYPEYFNYMPVPPWTDTYTSEQLPPYLSEPWAPYQRIQNINNIAPPAAKVYRGPCGDMRCNCQELVPQLPRSYNAFIPQQSEQRRGPMVMFQDEQVTITQEQWLDMAAHQEQLRMSQVQQF